MISRSKVNIGRFPRVVIGSNMNIGLLVVLGRKLGESQNYYR